MTFHLTCVHIMFSSALVGELPSFREIAARFTVCSLCILNRCNFSYFPFWF